MTMKIKATKDDGTIFVKTDFKDKDLWIEGTTVFRIKDAKLNWIHWGSSAVSG